MKDQKTKQPPTKRKVGRPRKEDLPKVKATVEEDVIDTPRFKAQKTGLFDLLIPPNRGKAGRAPHPQMAAQPPTVVEDPDEPDEATSTGREIVPVRQGLKELVLDLPERLAKLRRRKNVKSENLGTFTKQMVSKAAPVLLSGVLCALERGLLEGDAAARRDVQDIFNLRPQKSGVSIINQILQQQSPALQQNIAVDARPESAINPYDRIRKLLDAPREDQRGIISTALDAEPILVDPDAES